MKLKDWEWEERLKLASRNTDEICYMKATCVILLLYMHHISKITDISNQNYFFFFVLEKGIFYYTSISLKMLRNKNITILIKQTKPQNLGLVLWMITLVYTGMGRRMSQDSCC